MDRLRVLITEGAKASFIKDLKGNGVPYESIGYTLFIPNTPKSRMAVQLVKERYGMGSIIVKECMYNEQPNNA
jgi:hypothetical protein